MEAAKATVIYAAEENDRGMEQDCVYAKCLESGDKVGPVWGHGRSPVLRALAMLTEECWCGASFHQEEK